MYIAFIDVGGYVVTRCALIGWKRSAREGRFAEYRVLSIESHDSEKNKSKILRRFYDKLRI